MSVQWANLMLDKIVDQIKQVMANNHQDYLVYDHNLIKITQNQFQSIVKPTETKTIAFIDGGQAEIIAAANFCLSLVRVAAVWFNNDKKVKQLVNEFYLFSKAVYPKQEFYYESKIFTNHPVLVDETDLFLSSNDPTIIIGKERAPVTKITSVARRLAELALAKTVSADFIVLDGTLQKTLTNEEKYLHSLPCNVAAIAKSSTLCTAGGNSCSVILNQYGPAGSWIYPVGEETAFVKLNHKARPVFRFDGNRDVLPHLLDNCGDALFLGYPYGLILADKLARVSNNEKKALQLKFCLKLGSSKLDNYLATTNAHQILDAL